VCDICRDDLPLFEAPWCQRCGIPDRLAVCRCTQLPPEFVKVRSAGLFAGWLRSSIIALKYHDERDRAEYLGAMLAEAAPEVIDPVLVPTPLHPAKLRARGFNQSELVARIAADRLGWPVMLAVDRVRETRSQVGLGAAERAANMSGAFALSDEGRKTHFGGVTPVLVDDVFTTGATLSAVAAPLRAAGAGQIVVLTLAREL
jgi:ComF family protein